MTPFAGHELMTRARRVARLYHELLNAAMKYVTVVVGVARVYYKVLNYLWNSFSFFYSKQFKKVLIFYKRKFFITLYRRVEVYRP
jgi:hypothetical protein